MLSSALEKCSPPPLRHGSSIKQKPRQCAPTRQPSPLRHWLRCNGEPMAIRRDATPLSDDELETQLVKARAGLAAISLKIRAGESRQSINATIKRIAGQLDELAHSGPH